MSNFNYSFIRTFYEALGTDFDQLLVEYFPLIAEGSRLNSFLQVAGLSTCSGKPVKSFCSPVSDDITFLMNTLSEKVAASQDKPDTVVHFLKTMCLIGKEIERSWVTQTRFKTSCINQESFAELFFDECHSFSPVLFRGLFFMAYDSFGVPSNGFAKSHSDRALAFWMLRQLFLAFSKVQDLEFHIDEDEERDSFVSRVIDIPIITADNRVLQIARRLLQADLL